MPRPKTGVLRELSRALVLGLSLVAVGACDQPSPPLTVTSVAFAPTATLAPSASATPTDTPTSPIASCEVLPIRGFGKVWSEQSQVRTLLGCPTDKELGAVFEAQRYERGLLVWQEYVDDPRPFPPRGTILVLTNDGASQRLPDRWNPSVLDASTETPPAGLLRPTGRLGFAWREGSGIRDRLGWAIEPVRQGWGAWQGFTQGEMIWIPFQAVTPQESEDRWIFALPSLPPGQVGLRWLAFADTFRG